MAEQTAVERCRTVLEGGIPDRVPVCLLDFMPAAAMSGMTLREYCTDGRAMAEAHVVAWERLGHDMLDLENGVAALASAVGCEVGFESDDSPPWVMRPAIERIEDVARLRPIDPARDGLLPELLLATRLIRERLGERAFLLAEADQAPFSLASQIVGPETFFMALMDPDREEHVRRLLEYATEQVIRYARALVAAGAHMTGIGDSIAGPDVCAPALYRRFAWPYERQVVAALAADGAMVGLHICGDATPILGDMVMTGSQLLAVDFKIDRPAAKAAARGTSALIGTVDPSAVMALGSPADVRAAASADLAVLAPDGGFILAPGCALPFGTPVANMQALVATAHEEGWYPGTGASRGPRHGMVAGVHPGPAGPDSPGSPSVGLPSRSLPRKSM
jgi:MtaA/CmuA family methyltransferase